MRCRLVEIGANLGGGVETGKHGVEPVEPQRLRERALHEGDVPPAGVLDLDGPADAALGAPRVDQARVFHQGLELGLDLVGELEPVGPEDLDPVVLVGVVRRGDHHADATRGDDRFSEAAMEDRKKEGYF